MSQITATDWIWRDGEFIPWNDAQIHMLAHSVQYGSAIFEGVRSYETPRGPAIFRLEDHLKRLLGSCKIYRMDVRFSLDELGGRVLRAGRSQHHAGKHLHPSDGAARLRRGEHGAVREPGRGLRSLLARGGVPRGRRARGRGRRLRVDVAPRRPEHDPGRAKIAGNYLSGQLIKMEAIANGFNEAIALNTDGTISEGSGQNVFLVQNGTLYTSPIDGTLLHGITRDTLITIAREAGIPVREQVLPREALYTADEVFFCGTASEVTPVRSVDRIPVGDGKPGPMTLQLQQQFFDVVRGAVEDTHDWLTYVREARPVAQPA